MGPYGAVLADGSEYRGRYGLTPAELREFHLPRLDLLASADPDFLAVETIPDIHEAEVLVQLLDELDLPGWFSYSTQGLQHRRLPPAAGRCLRSGRGREAGVRGGRQLLPAVGDVLDAVTLAARLNTRMPVVAYPNSGEQWNSPARQWEGVGGYDADTRARLGRSGRAIRRLGRCRVGPRTIAAVADVVTRSGGNHGRSAVSS